MRAFNEHNEPVIIMLDKRYAPEAITRGWLMQYVQAEKDFKITDPDGRDAVHAILLLCYGKAMGDEAIMHGWKKVPFDVLRQTCVKYDKEEAIKRYNDENNRSIREVSENAWTFDKTFMQCKINDIKRYIILADESALEFHVIFSDRDYHVEMLQDIDMTGMYVASAGRATRVRDYIELFSESGRYRMLPEELIKINNAYSPIVQKRIRFVGDADFGISRWIDIVNFEKELRKRGISPQDSGTFLGEPVAIATENVDLDLFAVKWNGESRIVVTGDHTYEQDRRLDVIPRSPTVDCGILVIERLEEVHRQHFVIVDRISMGASPEIRISTVPDNFQLGGDIGQKQQFYEDIPDVPDNADGIVAQNVVGSYLSTVSIKSEYTVDVLCFEKFGIMAVRNRQGNMVPVMASYGYKSGVYELNIDDPRTIKCKKKRYDKRLPNSYEVFCQIRNKKYITLSKYRIRRIETRGTITLHVDGKFYDMPMQYRISRPRVKEKDLTDKKDCAESDE